MQTSVQLKSVILLRNTQTEIHIMELLLTNQIFAYSLASHINFSQYIVKKAMPWITTL